MIKFSTLENIKFVLDDLIIQQKTIQEIDDVLRYSADGVKSKEWIEQFFQDTARIFKIDSRRFSRQELLKILLIRKETLVQAVASSLKILEEYDVNVMLDGEFKTQLTCATDDEQYDNIGKDDVVITKDSSARFEKSHPKAH